MILSRCLQASSQIRHPQATRSNTTAICQPTMAGQRHRHQLLASHIQQIIVDIHQKNHCCNRRMSIYINLPLPLPKKMVPPSSNILSTQSMVTRHHHLLHSLRRTLRSRTGHPIRWQLLRHTRLHRISIHLLHSRGTCHGRTRFIVSSC